MTLKVHWFGLLWGSAALLAFSSCQSMREFLGFEFAEPRVSIHDMSIDGLQAQSLDITIALNVENPNSVDLELLSVEYEVLVYENTHNGADVLLSFKGQYAGKKPFVVASRSRAILPLKATVHFQDLAKVVDALLDKNQVKPAHIKLVAVFETPLGKSDYTYSAKYDLK